MQGKLAKYIIEKSGVQLERLNVHSHHGCNLRCSGCNHHSEYLHPSESIDTDRVIKDLNYFLDRVSVRTITVLGGEPLLNPKGTYDICDSLLKRGQQTNLITNGYMLDRESEWVTELLKRGLFLKISLHDPNATSNFKSVKKFLSNIHHSNLDNITYTKEWERKNSWFHIFKYDDNKVYPHESESKKSFEICESNCPQLYNGRLFKCGHSAYFKEILLIKNQLNDVAWKKYIDYKGFNLYNDTELSTFLKLVYEPEYICSSCPSEPNYITNNQDPSITKHRIPMKEIL